MFQLGPQPIPFPSQSAERKQPPSLLSGAGPQRAPAAAPSAQSLADLTKKETPSAGGPSLGSLVGSGPSAHSPYQSSSAGYGPKTSSFPSPPAHYAQNPSQVMSVANFLLPLPPPPPKHRRLFLRSHNNNFFFLSLSSAQRS